MRKVEITVYSFCGLNKTAQDRAVKDHLGINKIDHESLITLTYSDALAIGVEITSHDIRHSQNQLLGYFVGTLKDTLERIRSMSSDKRGSSELKTLADMYLSGGISDDNFLFYILYEYTKSLYKSFIHSFSTEGIVETIIKNEMEFYPDGKTYKEEV